MTRTRLLLIALLGVLIAAGTITAVMLASNDTQAARPCGIPKSVNQQPVSAKSAPTGGRIRVVEKGFSQVETSVSFGAVLVNTSDRIAYRTRVALRIYFPPEIVEPSFTDQGAVLTTREIPVIMPGQRVGLGIGIGSGAEVASIQLEPQTTTWLPNRALGTFTTATTKHVRTIPGKLSPISSAVRYSETSTNCRALTNRGTAVVFRDAAGKIIGGELAPPDGKGYSVSPPLPAPASRSCTPGTRQTWIAATRGIPAGTDDRRTRLYSYCDLNTPQPELNPEGSTTASP